jgi:catechol 2,3-dioxygenase-like lactoylglutathione lyase family enzyme
LNMKRKTSRAGKKAPALGKMVGFIPSHDLNRSKFFYTQVLGFRAKGTDPFALVLDAHGDTIRVVSLQGFKPASYTVLGWAVSNISKVVAELRKKGVIFQRYDGMKQDAHGVWRAPGGSLVAWFKDPDGNVLSVTQS